MGILRNEGHDPEGFGNLHTHDESLEAARLAFGRHERERLAFDPLRAQKREAWYWKNSREFVALRAAIEKMLMYPHNFHWTVQGFGMLRTYIGGESDPKAFRLNVWDHDLMVPHVSVIHDHPWSLTSWVISGEIRNVRYVEDHWSGEPYEFMVIKTGEGGGPDGARGLIRMRRQPTEIYRVGDKYSMTPTEVHVSGYTDGTVTLNDRQRVGDGEHARVFWHAGLKWIDAMPREADHREIATVTYKALENWNARP